MEDECELTLDGEIEPEAARAEQAGHYGRAGRDLFRDARRDVQRHAFGEGGGVHGQLGLSQAQADAAFRAGWAKAVRRAMRNSSWCLLERAIKGTAKRVPARQRRREAHPRISEPVRDRVAEAASRYGGAIGQHAVGRGGRGSPRSAILAKLERLRRAAARRTSPADEPDRCAS